MDCCTCWPFCATLGKVLLESPCAKAGGCAAGGCCGCTAGTAAAAAAGAALAGVTLIAVVIIEILKPDAAHGFRPSPFFPGSRLVAPEWGRTLNGWAGQGEQKWSLCCSTFEGCDTAAKFHAACDAHTPTLTVAHNAGGTKTSGHSNGQECTPSNPCSNPGDFTFGGFVRIPSLTFW